MNGHTTGGVVIADEREVLSGGLEVDHAHGELVLHRAQLGATDRGLLGDRADPPGRLAPRPLARELMDAAGHAAAGVEQPLGGYVLPGARARSALRSRGPPRRRAARGGASRRGADARAPQRPVAGEHQHQHGNVGDGLRHGDEAGADLVARAVRVVDDQQRRARCLASAGEYPEHGVGGPVPAA